MAQTKRQMFSVVTPEDEAEPSVQPASVDWSDPNAGTGALLRAARQHAGYSVRDVATQLRIKLSFIEAIEDGRYADLPGTPYAIGFVRSYAELMELDEGDLVARFKREVGGRIEPQDLYFPEPESEGRTPSLLLIVVALLIGALGYGGWYTVSRTDGGLQSLVPEVPERFSALLERAGSSTPVIDFSVRDPDEPHGTGAGGNGTEEGAAATGGETAVGSAAAGIPAGAEAEASGSGLEVDGGGPSTSVAQTTPGTFDAESISGTPGAQGVSGTSVAQGISGTPGAQSSSGADRGLGSGGRPGPDAAGPSTAPAVGETVASSASAGAAETPAETGVRSASASERPTGDADSALTEDVGAPDGAPTRVASAAPPPPPAPEATGLSADGRIRIEAVTDSWVQIRGPDGALVMTRVLRPGETYTVPDRDGLTMITGNAGGLQIVVDGESAPALGTEGDVVRNILLSPTRLLAGTAVPTN